jgi:hypothetical protein
MAGRSISGGFTFTQVFDGTYAVNVRLLANDGAVLAENQSAPTTVAGAPLPGPLAPPTISVTVV